MGEYLLIKGCGRNTKEKEIKYIINSNENDAKRRNDQKRIGISSRYRHSFIY